MRLAALLLLSWLPSVQAASVELAGFATDLPGPGPDDAVALRNTSDRSVSLAGFTLTDGEGTLEFPSAAMLGPGQTIVLAQRADAYLEATGRLPDYAVEGMDAAHRLVEQDPGFSLGLERDDLRLLEDGIVADRVVYGSAATDGPGWVGDALPMRGRTSLRWFAREDARDDDDRTDWEGLATRIVGADEFPPFEGNSTQILGYTAPESSLAMVERVIFRSESSLRINVYQWRDLKLLQTLRQWRELHPDARLDVLLEAHPVGESRDELSERAHVVLELREVGANVHLSSTDRYPYNHAKYVISDDNSILIQSENFVPSGLPADGTSGNRGYGILLADPALTKRFIDVFEEDFRIEPHGATDAGADAPEFARPLLPPRAPATGDFSYQQGFVQTFLITAPHRPDPATDPILQRIANATARIRVAHLSLPPTWTDIQGREVPNPYLDALRAAARRGVLVQVLLDGHFLDAEDPHPDNEDTVRLLEADGRTLPIAARLMTGDRVLHAKTMVVDDAWTLVGSMNWNANSVLNNREVSILVHDPESSALHARAFDTDWREAGPGGLGIPVAGAGPLLLVLAGLVLIRRVDAKRSYRRRP